MQSLTSHLPASLKNRLPRARRAPHDPAPSRAVYRMQRMWLTPLYRSIMRVGVPTFLILTALGWFFSNPTNRYAIGEQIAELRRSVETRPEFMVKMMAINGATPIVDAAIRQLLPVEFPVSSFDLDLEAIQQEVAGLDVIKTADILIRSGGVLAIDVKERDPVMVWRRDGALELIDPEGHRVATLTARTARADLPLVVGAGANAAVPEALALFAAAGPLNDALRGLVRMGERRWDVALTSGARIMLPEENAVAALEQVLALNQAQDLLARHITHIDMRNPLRPTLRLSEAAVEEFRHIRSLSLE